MSNQNNAAQPVLTDDEINDICERPASNTTMRAENDRALARATEQALLSKLRAPVADERAAIQHHLDLVKAYGDQLYCKASASNPTDKKSWSMSAETVLSNVAESYRAALASAPLAQPSAAIEDFAHEVWAAAQSPHGEPVEKSVSRVASILAEFCAPVADERALPPLPKPAILWHSDFTNQTYYGYTAEHMRDYGRAALASAPVAGEAQRPHLNVVLDHAADRLADAGMREDASIVRGMKVPNDGSKTEPLSAAPQASEPTGASQLSADEADALLADPSALAALADGLESIPGNENAALAAILARREADRLATMPVMPDDEEIAGACINASDIDGIAYDGSSFERGYRAALSAQPKDGGHEN